MTFEGDGGGKVMLNELSIEKITVGERHRRDLGDVAALARSIETVGLLHPVVVDDEGNLICGARRLAAFLRLGRQVIPAHVIDIDDALLGERDENLQRLDFAPDELVALGRALEERERARAKERILVGHNQYTEPSGNFPAPSKGRVRDKVAAVAGVSGRTYEKAKAVVEAAEQDPEAFGSLLDEMKRSRKVNSAHRKLKQRQDEKRVLGLAPVKGRFKTLIVDPPWDYEWLSLAGRAAPGYAVMSHAELLAMPVASWAEDNCHLYVWTTNNFMTRACDLVAAWGFQHKTVLTWVKPRIGLGSYFRNSTEHVLFAVRGEMTTRVKDIPTHFLADTGEHSAKPDVFYDIVRRASYPPCGEAFQRDSRDGFTSLYEGRAT